jgi:hypothetical protein
MHVSQFSGLEGRLLYKIGHADSVCLQGVDRVAFLSHNLSFKRSGPEAVTGTGESISSVSSMKTWI